MTGAIGIDLGGTNLRLALITAAGAVTHRLRYATSDSFDLEPLLRTLTIGIEELVAAGAGSGVRVTAIGVGVPGLVTASGFIHSAVNLPFLTGINIAALLAERSGLPVTAANDANAIAYGEKAFGAGRPFSSFLMLTVGTGIGSGLILNGRLWTGRDGLASEYGHATVEPEGRPCPCGNRGCVEQYASATAIVRGAREELAAGRVSLLSSAGDVTAEAVARAAVAGDPLARELFARAGAYLGIVTATALNFLNLEALIVGGGVAASFTLLAEPMKQEIEMRAFAVMAQRVPILRGALGDDAGLLGSAALALKAVDG